MSHFCQYCCILYWPILTQWHSSNKENLDQSSIPGLKKKNRIEEEKTSCRLTLRYVNRCVKCLTSANNIGNIVAFYWLILTHWHLSNKVNLDQSSIPCLNWQNRFRKIFQTCSDTLFTSEKSSGSLSQLFAFSLRPIFFTQPKVAVSGIS